jgi:tetratricopeptide (TPR) repeat protein
MGVLVALCAHPGEILSSDDLLRRCWGKLVVGENQVHKAIAQLRRALGDSASAGTYIENVRKRGYRAVAPVLLAPGGTSQANRKGWGEGSPYMGLDAFNASHSSVFFGRDAALRQLHETVCRLAQGDRCLLLVLGSSGSGKTSLIQAGLLPALIRYEPHLRAVAETTLDLGAIGTASPCTALAASLLDLEFDQRPLLSGHSAHGLVGKLMQTPDVVLGELRALIARQPQARAVLFVDRLEALFSAPGIDSEERRDFLLLLDRLARSSAMVVLVACRNDFYPQLARHALLMEGKPAGGHFDLQPPTRAEIAQMIRLPAAAAGLRFDIDEQTQAQLDDVLCDAAADNPDALPLLQYTLHELYLQRSDVGVLTFAAYRSLGGIEGAVGQRAETVLNSLSASSQAALPRILSLLVTLSANDDTVSGRHALWSALQGEAERVLVNRLVEQRLFVSLTADRQSVFGVAHEALLRQWPRVVEWIAAHRNALRVRSRIEGLMALWSGDDRHAQRLLPRGRQLEEARELLGQDGIPLSTGVRLYIQASSRRVRRADRIRIVAITGFVLLGFAAGLFGVLARRATALAQQRQQEAEGLMSYMLGGLADQLRPLGKLDLLDGVANVALHYLRQQRVAGLNPIAREQQAHALQTIAEVARAHGDSSAAHDALVQAKLLLDSNLTPDKETVAVFKDLGTGAFWLGQLQLDQGDPAGAGKYFQQYLRYAQRMSQLKPNDASGWIEMSYAHNSLGSVAQMQGEVTDAAAHFEASIALKRRALAQRPADRGLRAELADSLSWLGSAHETQGDLQQASSLYEQEQAQLRALHQQAPAEYQWTYRLLAALRRHAQLLSNQGNDLRAELELQEAAALGQQLLQHDAGNQLWQRAALNVASLADAVRADRGDLQAALSGQLVTAAKLSALSRLDPRNKSWRTLEATSHAYAAETLLSLRRAPDAQAQMRQALNLMAPLGQPLGSNTARHQSIADYLLLLADAQAADGQDVASQSSCQQALDFARAALANNAHDYRTLVPMVHAELCLDQRQQAAPLIAELARFGYRRTRYLITLSHYSLAPKDES